MQPISFQSIIPKYKVIFFDSYGVLVNHRGVINGASKVLENIKKADTLIRVLTNSAARTAEKQAEKYRRTSLEGIKSGEIITSGMMAKVYLANKIREGAVAYMGTDQAAAYIIQSNLKAIPIREVNEHNIDDIKAMVFLDDEGFDWNHDINATVNLLRKRNIPTIVANSDKIYPVTKNDVSIATGGIAQLVESILGRAFIHFGKPDSQIFTYAYNLLPPSLNITKRDILMVGDTLHTDILGGNKFGIDTLLVLSGNTRADDYQLKIKATGVIPDYVCSSIVS